MPSTPPPSRPRLDPALLRRAPRPVVEEDETPDPPSVSSGPVDKVIELAFNPSREKIREVTIVDRMQGRLFPLLDMINLGRLFILEVSLYRQNADEYRRTFKRERPIQPSLMDEFMFRTAQWQKSVAGTNLKSATDLALAEMETKAEGDDGSGGADAWKE